MIPLTPDTDDVPEWLARTREHCCFCAEPTNLWYAPRDVAVCAACGETRSPDEVPTKDQWWDSPQGKGVRPEQGVGTMLAEQKTRLTPKAYKAQETRWRYLSVCTKDNEFHQVELGDRTKAVAFAEHLIKTGAARKVSLIDVNHADSGQGWATLPDR